MDLVLDASCDNFEFVLLLQKGHTLKDSLSKIFLVFREFGPIFVKEGEQLAFALDQFSNWDAEKGEWEDSELRYLELDNFGIDWERTC